jgi:hypothetical protein
MLIATPYTTWSTPNEIVAIACNRAPTDPNTTAEIKPNQGPCLDPTKPPAHAPRIIIPSSPMLTTPARSENKPPRPAKIIGTESKSVYSKIVECHGKYPKSYDMLTPTEAELLKYYSNVFNSVRIIFENELRKLSGDKLSIIRLSGLFGPFLKKNLLFDIKNNNNDMLSKINFESQLQWYNLKNLKNDILKNLNKKILNLVNEPIKNKEIFEFSSLNLKNNLEITRSVYNIKTYHHNDGFFNKKEEVLKEIDDYLTT